MPDEAQTPYSDHNDLTIPSAARLIPKAADDPPSEPLVEASHTEPIAPPTTGAPWLLQQYLSDHKALSSELNRRFPMLPLLSVARFRNISDRRGTGALATADGVATLTVEVDGASGLTQFSFTYSSMLSLSFRLDNLTGTDRASWLGRMRHEKEGVSFLWGQARWESDYLICVSKRKFAHLYAFSPHGSAAAVRLMPEVKTDLLDWLEARWQTDDEDTQPPQQLLTW